MLLTKLLLTVITLGYSAIPAVFDFNNTHTTNPSWTGHARFHVVWQVTSYCLVAVMLLACVWLPILPGNIGMILAAAAAVATYGGFFTAVLTRRLYSGAYYDTNGVQPIHIAGIKCDVNITLFTPMAVLTAWSVWLLTQLAA